MSSTRSDPMRTKNVAEPELGAALTKLRTLSSCVRAAPPSPAFVEVGPLLPCAAPRRTELEVARGDVVVRVRLAADVGPAALARLVRRLAR
jgi:hypothetical protein